MTQGAISTSVPASTGSRFSWGVSGNGIRPTSAAIDSPPEMREASDMGWFSRLFGIRPRSVPVPSPISALTFNRLILRRLKLARLDQFGAAAEMDAITATRETARDIHGTGHPLVATLGLRPSAPRIGADVTRSRTYGFEVRPVLVRIDRRSAMLSSTAKAT